MSPIDRYLDELIDYGGQPFPRAEAIRLLERRQRVSFKLHLCSASKTHRKT